MAALRTKPKYEAAGPREALPRPGLAWKPNSQPHASPVLDLHARLEAAFSEPAASRDMEKWSPRRALFFAVGASAAGWGLVALTALATFHALAGRA
jgi:hypothetical protein